MADPLRTALEQRCKEIREKIAKRKNQAGTAENVAVLETTLNELERLLAADKGDA